MTMQIASGGAAAATEPASARPLRRREPRRAQRQRGPIAASDRICPQAYAYANENPLRYADRNGRAAFLVGSLDQTFRSVSADSIALADEADRNRQKYVAVTTYDANIVKTPCKKNCDDHCYEFDLYARLKALTLFQSGKFSASDRCWGTVFNHEREHARVFEDVARVDFERIMSPLTKASSPGECERARRELGIEPFLWHMQSLGVQEDMVHVGGTCQ